MVWKKLVEREGDFLKNYLLYESFVENFRKTFKRNHPNFLTIRRGNKFTHYADFNSSKEFSRFIKKELENDQNFIKKSVSKGKKYFEELIDFAEKLNKINFNKLNNEEIKRLAQKYFELYKKPYPYVNITPYVDEFEENEEDISTLSGWRLFSRKIYDNVHKLTNPFFKEIGKRVNISLEGLKSLKPEEIINLLDRKNLDFNKLIKKRKICYFLYKNGKFLLKENDTYTIEEEKSDEMKGRGTFPAFCKGKVRIIKNESDIEKLDQGEIIVSKAITAELVTLNVGKARAIITEEGGITCHAANLSREFKIPALIGVKNIAKILKDGDVVEVDTNKGTVRKIIKGD